MKTSISDCRTEFINEHQGNVVRAMQAMESHLRHAVRKDAADASRAIHRAVCRANLCSEQAAAITAAAHSREVDILRANCMAEHEREIEKLKDRIRILASHAAILESKLAEKVPGSGTKSSRDRDRSGTNSLPSAVEDLPPEMIDFSTLEDIGGLRLQLENQRGANEDLATANTKLRAELLRATSQTKSLKGKMIQQHHAHARKEMQQEAEMERLRARCTALEAELNSPSSDAGHLRQEITARLKVQMTELAVAESKRNAEREKKNQLSLQEAHAKDLEQVRKEGMLDLRQTEDRHRARVATLQEKHRSELDACNRRWRKQFEVMQGAVEALDNEHLSNAIVTTHSRILQSAAILFPRGVTGTSPSQTGKETRLPLL